MKFEKQNGRRIKMTTKDKLALMKEINRRNDEAIKAWKDRAA
jgi:hypothetical protein